MISLLLGLSALAAPPAGEVDRVEPDGVEVDTRRPLTRLEKLEVITSGRARNTEANKRIARVHPGRVVSSRSRPRGIAPGSLTRGRARTAARAAHPRGPQGTHVLTLFIPPGHQIEINGRVHDRRTNLYLRPGAYEAIVHSARGSRHTTIHVDGDTEFSPGR